MCLLRGTDWIFIYRQFNIQQFYVLPTQCIYVFCVDLRTNSDDATQAIIPSAVYLSVHPAHHIATPTAHNQSQSAPNAAQQLQLSNQLTQCRTFLMGVNEMTFTAVFIMKKTKFLGTVSTKSQ